MRAAGVNVRWPAVVALLGVIAFLGGALLAVRSGRGQADVASRSDRQAAAAPSATGATEGTAPASTDKTATPPDAASTRAAPGGSGRSGPVPSTGPGSQASTSTTTPPPSSTTTVNSGGASATPASTTASTTAPRREPPSILGRVVFTSDRAVYGAHHDSDIWVMDADGGNPKDLTNFDGPESSPDLSADGRRIVWLRYVPVGWVVMTMDSDGTNQVQITRDPGSYQQPRWSPDGRRILYVLSGYSNSSLRTMKPDGSDDREVFASSTLAIRSASWAPDGRRVVVAVSNSAPPETTPAPGPEGVWVVDLDNRSATQIYTEEARSAAWSPLGDRIAFIGGAALSDVFTMNADGSGVTRITTGPGADQGGPTRSDPAWSPDGSRIAFTLSQPNLDSDVWDMAADGTEPRNLTNLPGYDEQATF